MKNGIPNVYWSFRSAWSATHLVMLAVLTVWLAGWLLQDSHGEQMFNEGSAWVEDLSNQLASWVPFPWDA